MGGKIIFSADSTCDITAQQREQYCVNIIPLTVTMEGRAYKDGVDLTPDDIYANYDRNHSLPTTSAVSPFEYEEFFRSHMGPEDSLIHVNISKKLSSCYENACVAAEKIPNVHVIDSANLSTGSALVLLHGVEMARAGVEVEEIARRMRADVLRVDASFVVDTLEYLHKGGRCTSLAKLGANLLKLRPCIEVAQGAMGVGKKYRGAMEKCLNAYVQERLQGREDIDLSRIFITHSGCDEALIEQVRAQVVSLLPFADVCITRAGCTITTHCGPGTLGILYMRKE